ncbi:hypothetical protein NXW35_07610 [Parabacteroides distasonis]|nr:hypothetical protein [Parabacteroides distasonis]UVQ81846.1 hypothetical protein NXW35_07610 [Parabacteroides distasonis]
MATVNTNGVVTGIQPGMVKVAVETSNGIRAYKDIVVYLKLG